ncbi:MAG: NUDIX hydrolase [Barrevirus sp.]|uniref:NUDIX hydrolase n=1 Tax=Barrevirus sp. TaxID=2487763 RepID=A0A3G4ZQQ7_9VIRU|nr:MAG: NUDIX hydrolase [Barrevirus sp.]
MKSKNDKNKDSNVNKKEKGSTVYCINCDSIGHASKNCPVPITSYGIILLSFDETIINQKLKNTVIKNFCNRGSNYNFKIDEPTGINISGPEDLELFCYLKNTIKFLLMRRKHTLGFLEFVRGRYAVDNIDGIIFLFKQMTPEEIKLIATKPFDYLWDAIWGNKINKTVYHGEYVMSKEKYSKLKNDEDNTSNSSSNSNSNNSIANNNFLNLKFYTDNVVPVWNFAEWGFPKGRRNMKERNVDAAIREFQEESGFDELNDDFILLDNIEPIEETLIGTNGINYRHIYYVAISTSDRVPAVDPTNKVQMDEVGDIKYMNYEETIKIVRAHHTDRQKIITQIYMYFINYLIGLISEVKPIN